jgi:DNA-binding response OmpR family regulator
VFSQEYDRTILIVDDIADNLFLLETVLSAEGYRVKSASSGEEALVQLHTTTFDLILVDVMMPGLNGFELTQRIRQSHQSSVPIILLTAYDQASVAQGFKVGANDFIQKPIDLDELVERVANVLSSQQKNQIRPSTIAHEATKRVDANPLETVRR